MTENDYDKLKDAICELVNIAKDATSREVFEILDNAGVDVIDCLDKLSGYEAIGTIEEFKALKEGGRFLEFLYNHISPNEMEQYLSMYQAKDKVAVNGYADQCGLMSAN